MRPAPSARLPIGFGDPPPPPPAGHERTEAERAGRPYEGQVGQYGWQKRYEDGGGRIFWANMPSPTLDPRDPILAPPGTVQLSIGNGTFIDVLRAPRFEVVCGDAEPEEYRM